MDTLANILQIVIALGIFNVWILRYNRPTNWRGGSAKSMKEEFAVYGLPGWFMILVGCLKLILACLLIAAIWQPEIRPIAAAGMAVLMLGAIAMHIKVRDPGQKSAPAFSMLVMSTLVAVLA